jgi:hypothetical protein
MNTFHATPKGNNSPREGEETLCLVQFASIFFFHPLLRHASNVTFNYLHHL